VTDPERVLVAGGAEVTLPALFVFRRLEN